MSNSLGLPEITLEEFYTVLDIQMKNEIYTPLLGLGPAGIGKTEIIRDYAIRNNLGYVEIRLVNYQEGDIIGVPLIVNDDNNNPRTKFATTDILPDEKRDGEIGILVLDEITACSKGLRTIALQLTDISRGVGQYKLPKKWLVVCLGNGPDDGGMFIDIEKALISRGFAYRVMPTFEYWLKYAYRVNIHDTIISYLKANESDLLVINKDENDMCSPCPRLWSNISKILKKIEMQSGSRVVIPAAMVDIFAGNLGSVVGTKFSTFYRYNDKMVNPQDIFLGRANKGILEMERGLQYFMIQNIIGELKRAGDMYGRGKLAKSGIKSYIENMSIWLLAKRDGRNPIKDLLAYAVKEMMDVSDEISDLFVEAVSDESEYYPNLCKLVEVCEIIITVDE